MAREAGQPRRPVPQKRAGPSYRVFRIDSWQKFLDHVIHPPYSNWAFRGERDERWPLYSSLSRYLQNAKVDPGAWPLQEARILRIFNARRTSFWRSRPIPMTISNGWR